MFIRECPYLTKKAGWGAPGLGAGRLVGASNVIFTLM